MTQPLYAHMNNKTIKKSAFTKWWPKLAFHNILLQILLLCSKPEYTDMLSTCVFCNYECECNLIKSLKIYTHMYIHTYICIYIHIHKKFY
jgi:hypothetical protein